METLVTIERALSIARETPVKFTTETVSLNQAHNRILASDLQSKVDDPPFDNSAMDGWAVDSKGTTPREIASSPVRAGTLRSQVEWLTEPEAAHPIMTGAPIPLGADAIVMKEDGVNGKAHTNFIRKTGENFLKGDTLLRAGQLMTSSAISLAATMGYDTVTVRTKPRVAVISTGDELVRPGQELIEGQIYESNSFGLCALLEKVGCIPVVHNIVEDSLKGLRKTLNSLDCDAILTSGGVSMGEFDYVRKLMEEEGNLHFWKVAMRPGGPPLFGTWNGTPLFGLPGNPVSSHLVFMLLVAPWLAPEISLAKKVHVRMKDPVKGAPGKVCLRRIQILTEGDELVATTHTHQGSGNIHSMVAHNGVTYLQPDTNADTGNIIQALWFND